jgi:hypothetical protein
MSELVPSIRIYFENLAVPEDEGGRLPLRELTSDNHIHGGLRIITHNRLVPHLGFFGADDVCFSDWIAELESVLSTFDGRENAQYIFDDPEQGQPAFQFDREGEYVFLSIVDSLSSDGKGDASWQRAKFRYDDLRHQFWQ